MSEIENLKIGNGGTLHIVGNEDIIANEWEAGQVYIENRSYVIREHKLLMCNTTHTSVEPFDPDKWTEKNIGEALGTAGSANMIECTLAEYNAWKAGGQLINETVYVITDAPNLNATAQDISYDGGATTVKQAIDNKLPRVVYSKKDWANSHSFATPNDTTFMLYTDSDTSVAKVRIYNNNQVTFNNISGSSITGATYTNGTLTVAVNNRGLVAVQII